MKKIFLALLFVLCLTALCACTSKLPASEQTEAPAENVEAGEKGESGEAAGCSHEFEEKVVIASTCVKSGVVKKTCKLCKHSVTQAAPLAEHKEIVVAGKAATCTNAGLTDGKACSECKNVLVAQEPINPTGHTVVIDAGKAPSCVAEGLTEGSHCSVCESVLKEQEVIPVNENAHVRRKRVKQQITCALDGIVEIYCESCEKALEEKTYPKGHYPAEHEYCLDGICATPTLVDSSCQICQRYFMENGKYTFYPDVLGEYLDSEANTGNKTIVYSSFDYFVNGEKCSTTGIVCANNGEWGDEDQDRGLYFGNYKAFDDIPLLWLSELVIDVTDDFLVVPLGTQNIFKNNTEKGEYALSGKYYFYDNSPYSTGFDSDFFRTNIDQSVNFKYVDSTETEKTSNRMTISNNLGTTGMAYLSYEGLPDAATFDDYTVIWNVQTWVDFGESQSVSKEFFIHITSYLSRTDY